MSIMASEQAVPDPPRYDACIAHEQTLIPQSGRAGLREECEQQYRALKVRALGFLISTEWLLGEAAEQGLKVGDSAAKERQLERRYARAEPDDVKFAVKAELAAAALRQRLRKAEPKITLSQIMAYYRQHLRRFERPERRYFDIIERLPSEAAARRVMQVAGRGSLSRMAAVHESVDRPDPAEIAPKKRAILRAIFAAKAHTLVGPAPLNGLYSVFEVTRIMPHLLQPLADVRGSIETEISRDREDRRLARFVRAWRNKWLARTNCRPGYVVQKCKQYKGDKAREDPLAFN
jgi:foldase protein PrsA